MSTATISNPIPKIQFGLDLETLSLEPDAPVLSIGLVRFSLDPENPVHENLYIQINPQSYAGVSSAIRGALPFQESQDTLAWWAMQDQKVRAAAFSGTVDWREAGDRILNFMGLDITEDTYNMWAKPAAFDIPILNNLLHRGGYSEMHYRTPKCMRTMFELFPIPDNLVPVNHEKHHALADSVCQVEHLRQIVKHYNLRHLYE